MLTFNKTEYCELNSLRAQCEHRNSPQILEHAHIARCACMEALTLRHNQTGIEIIVTKKVHVHFPLYSCW